MNSLITKKPPKPNIEELKEEIEGKVEEIKEEKGIVNES